MLHPDYQYPSKLITAMAGLICLGMFGVVLGSRILAGAALKGGMPYGKYFFNRFLTFFENIFLGEKLSEHHTGHRAFSREVLIKVPLLENSDDFVFDDQMLAKAIYFGFHIGEMTAPSRYTKEFSPISLARSVIYGCGVFGTAMKFLLGKKTRLRFRIFDGQGRKIEL